MNYELLEIEEVMDIVHVKRVIEALLFVSGRPVALKRISELIPDLGLGQLRQLIHALDEEYRCAQRAFSIQEVAGGYQLVTDEALASWITRALRPPKPDAVSTAAMETLAIIAYRQPVTKAEVELIRGVDVTASLDTLIERQLIRMVGRKDSPGRPFLYGTTTQFLQHFGLKSLEALPRLEIPTVKEATPEEPEPATVLSTADVINDQKDQPPPTAQAD